MAKFKKKLRIENATSFKLEYSDDSNELKTKTFKSYKLMEQFPITSSFAKCKAFCKTDVILSQTVFCVVRFHAGNKI